ncbi:hypothetical protein N7490_010978 [Penicillium lividum]|nr:hypothetical protein N7490_010978 [Penicillium lividum]
MSFQRAIQIQAPKLAKLALDAPDPKLRNDYIKVKTVAVALNPTDWKHIDFLGSNGAIVGCDYSGIVEEVGPAVTNGLKVGDKVAGFVHGSNSDNQEDGAFAEHIVAKAVLQIKVPDNMSMEEAATLGVGITTVGQALYQSLGLPLPTAPAATPFAVLIYGGSTATGTLAIQFAKLSGLTVLTTCSPHNFDLVRRLGADYVFDYKSPTVGADICAAADGRLAHVFDCISNECSQAISAEAIGSAGGKYSSLTGIQKFPRDDVVSLATLAYTGLGETFHKGAKEFPAEQTHLQFQAKFWKLAGELLARGMIKTHPLELRAGGLEAILDGVDDLRQDKVSGVKLVYRI